MLGRLVRSWPSSPMTSWRQMGGASTTSSAQAKLQVTIQEEADRNLRTSAYRMAGVIVAMGAAAYYVQRTYEPAIVEERRQQGAKQQAPEQLKKGVRALSTSSLMSSSEWRPFKLLDTAEVSHNTKIYRFELPHSADSLQLPVASCVLVRLPKNDAGKHVIRPYTPITADSVHGRFDLMVKTYEKGNVSKYFAGLKPGDSVDFKGPISKLPYKANGNAKLGMIAGGTGITPMLQVIEQVLSNPFDKTEISLVYANVTTRDILLKNKLDHMASQHPDRLKIHYVVEKGKLDSSMSQGYVTPETISQYLPGPDEDAMVYVCGPPPMMDAISGNKAKDKSQGELSGALKTLGYTSSNVFKF